MVVASRWSPPLPGARGLLRTQREIGLPELEEARRAQAAERKGKRRPSGEHEVGHRRQIPYEEPERLARGPVGQRVNVVKRDHEIVGDRC